VSADVAVSDASPLIALYQIDRLDLLRNQFDHVAVPPAIELEVAPSVGVLPTWMHRHHVPVHPDFLRRLDPGEREAIAVAVQIGANFLVIDDLPGRHAAVRLGLRVIGSLGLMVRAKRRGLTGDVRPLMDALIRNALFVSDRVYREILELAGEPFPDDRFTCAL
jgi:predicted nucleic acid-binding protein